MSPQEALAAAHAAGVEVRIDGKDLIVSAAGDLPDDICAMLSRHKANLVEHLRAQATPTPSAPPPSPPPAPVPVRPWSAADWRLFHNERQAAAEVALGETRGQARAYAYRSCIQEWGRTRPGSSEDQAIAALADKGILDPSPPPPVVEHQQATGSEDDLPPAPAGVGGAGTDVTGSTTPITAPQQPQEDGWSSEDWRAYRDERAAIAEYDGKLSRLEAEELARHCCVAEWLYRNPVSSPPGPCPVCGETDRPNDDLLPVGLGGGQVWLHLGCSAAWRAGRIAEAVAALAEMGIGRPEDSPRLSSPPAKEGAP